MKTSFAEAQCLALQVKDSFLKLQEELPISNERINRGDSWVKISSPPSCNFRSSEQ